MDQVGIEFNCYQESIQWIGNHHTWFVGSHYQGGAGTTPLGQQALVDSHIYERQLPRPNQNNNNNMIYHDHSLFHIV